MRYAKMIDREEDLAELSKVIDDLSNFAHESERKEYLRRYTNLIERKWEKEFDFAKCHILFVCLDDELRDAVPFHGSLNMTGYYDNKFTVGPFGSMIYETDWIETFASFQRKGYGSFLLHSAISFLASLGVDLQFFPTEDNMKNTLTHEGYRPGSDGFWYKP